MWNREHHAWHSPRLGRSMEMLAFGHGGARVVVFPTSMGRFYEWEDRGMIAALSEHLRQGWLQIFCVDSVDAESWYDRGKHPSERTRRHQQYEDYLLHEVLPFTWNRNRNPFLILVGASFGAYHAVNLALRHPGLVGRVIGLAGLYDIKRIIGGYSDPTVYAHDPSHFMIHEHDQARLEAMRRMDMVLAIGGDDPMRPDNDHLSKVLWDKDIWHAYRVWDGWCHDWPWWKDMIARYIGGSQ